MTDQHTCREAAQLASGSLPAVKAWDVVDDAALGETVLELTIQGDRVGSNLLTILGSFGLSLDPDRTATRGDPTHTVVVAR